MKTDAAVQALEDQCFPEIWQADFEAGRLERMLPDFAFKDGLYAVYPSRHLLSRKVRVFVDFLVQKLSLGG
jgi:DNA-binding transcriptional LysR family regulator